MRLPELHPQWSSLDLADLLARDVAFINMDAQNSILSEFVCLAEEGIWRTARHEDGSLSNILKLAAVCREAHMPFMWLRYDRFIGEKTPRTVMDQVQYRYWNEHYKGDDERKVWEAELVEEVKAILDPEDVTFIYPTWNIFNSTAVTRYLAMWGTRTLVISGYHTDWCVEMATRSARDLGNMPVVVGDACGTTEGLQEATLRQINDCYAPVISTALAVDLIRKGAGQRLPPRA
jgi:nicotinamidase-related amidase